MPNSINRLFRRLRESHGDGGKKPKKASVVSGCCSRRTSSTISQPSNRKMSVPVKCKCHFDGPLLPEALLFRIFDGVDSPFELFSLRLTNKNCADFVRSKISRVSEMDLRRVSFDQLSSLSANSSGTSAQSETTVILQGEQWHVHPSGYKVLCRMRPANDGETDNEKDKSKANDESSASNPSEDTSAGTEMLCLEVLVDEEWTSREISILCSLVNEFRQSVQRISVDAPIFELIVANFASIDLNRWFAYQCFVKAVDDGQMGASLNKMAAQLRHHDENDQMEFVPRTSELYWPNAKTILIRTTERESVHLARVLFYGVRSTLFMDRRRLDRLALLVNVADAAIAQLSMADRPKELVRNLYHFRCWAGSPGFDDRFSQQWRCVA
ncbi:hypothetical protein niasHT_007653 [Heterodera trifolii]|uniref:F-box domain-containing protein n=1 Tax=Heterodera trifolii TaxID=157864 RepID=A0ABD2LRH5_9BILA